MAVQHKYLASEFVPAQYADELGARTKAALWEKVHVRVIKDGDLGGESMPAGFSILLIMANEDIRNRRALRPMAAAFLSGQLSGLSLTGLQVHSEQKPGEWRKAGVANLAYNVK